MPYLDARYMSWDEMLSEVNSGLFEDTKCITTYTLDEIMRDLEGEIIETMG